MRPVSLLMEQEASASLRVRMSGDYKTLKVGDVVTFSGSDAEWKIKEVI